MKKWMQRLVEQLDMDWKKDSEGKSGSIEMSEERATLLFIIDTFNKHLFEVEDHPVRKVREILDEFSRELIQPDLHPTEKVLFRLRQFLSSYRIDEFSYIQKTFDDFRNIIWDFVDQLAEDLAYEQDTDLELKESLNALKEAVESNSIDQLRTQSRQFIDSYIEFHTRKEKHRSQRMDLFKKNLDTVKKQLVDANNTMRLDHLTKAFNRKSFEEQARNNINLFKLYKKPVTLIMIDIDHFKKVNDTFGHAIGDFVLQALVKMLKDVFIRDVDIVARLGGEEFAVLLPDYQIEHALVKAETAMNKIRNEVFVQDDMKIQFTISMGIAEIQPGESYDHWMKRADQALYTSKKTGRNKYTIA